MFSLHPAHESRLLANTARPAEATLPRTEADSLEGRESWPRLCDGGVAILKILKEHSVISPSNGTTYNDAVFILSLAM